MWGSLADAQSAPVELPADSDGSGRGSSESHQHSETLPPRTTAASHAPALRLARHASAPPGQHHPLVMMSHAFTPCFYSRPADMPPHMQASR